MSETCKDKLDVCWANTPSRQELWQQIREIPASMWTRAFENLALVLALMLASGYSGTTWIDFNELQACGEAKSYWATLCVLMQMGLACVVCNFFFSIETNWQCNKFCVFFSLVQL